MSVSKYINNDCKYIIDRLAKVVYLIDENAAKTIYIDNCEAYIEGCDSYVEGITQEPLALAVYNIELSDTDELDERYKFTHTLSFSMNGYANYKDFGGRYYAIVKTIDNEYWLVNPMFPCKVTYTYTLNGNSSHTDFTLSTVSNHPMLRIYGMDEATPYVCGYQRCTIDALKLNESKYSLKTANHVLYTNNGFKDVVYNKNSAVFTETFDGNNIKHELDFNIKFDLYKSSWHYTLLEFTENKYAAVIKTSCNKYILCGFYFGLQPSFNVSANDDMTMDNIQIQLVDSHDNGSFIGYEEDVTIEKDGTTKYVFTNKYNGYECIGNNLARYLLKEEVDALMNPTGNYMVLAGYEDRFSFLNIVGTFNETETFNSYDCADTCKIQTSFPVEFTFNNQSCREYNLISDTDWSISSSANYITVSPTSGEANSAYTVTICNTLQPSEVAVKSTLTVDYCNKTKVYDVTVQLGDECLPAGSVFDISANGQYVIIPTSCCVRDAEDLGGTITNISIQPSYIRVYVPQNNSGNPRQFIISITYCDGKEGEAIINQGTGFERWVKEDTVCVGTQLCDVERRYTGTSIDNINTPTEETRTNNCADSSECGGKNLRWIDSTETTCSGGKKFIVQVEQVSNDGGATWSNTGNKRLGAMLDDPTDECSGVEEYEEWREADGYICDNTTKYNRLQLYVSTDRVNWYATSTYKKGETVLEADSEDCGKVTPSTEWDWEDWRVVENDFICDDGNKYERLRRWVSNDQVETKAEVTNWTPTDVYKRGDLLEANSQECGYDPTVSGNCSEYRDDGDTICDGYDKYEYLRKYVRDCEDCNSCSTPWTATNIYKRGDKIKEHSLDCGYVPTETYFEWREDGYFCDGYDKYTKYRKYISETGNEGDWYQTNIYKYSVDPIEVDSTDCGYVPRIEYDYQWIPTSNTGCVGTTKYYLYKKQRKRKGGDYSWEDVIPTQYSINGDGTLQPIVAESPSSDCGYVPPIEPTYRWVTMDINRYWICADCDDTPDEQTKIEYRLNQEEAAVQSALCNDNSTLVASDYNSQDIVYAKVGGCVTSIGNDAFKGRTNLSEILIPSTVTTIGDNAFSGCTSLVDFSLPMSVTRIGAKAFMGCIQLNKIVLPNSLTALDDDAFNGCKNMPTINIPSNIAMIPTRCFNDCDGLTDVYLPENVVLLKSYAFANCSGLVNLTCYAAEPPAIYQTTFQGVNSELKIYVPSASVEAYKTAWSAYADKIVAI